MRVLICSPYNKHSSHCQLTLHIIISHRLPSIPRLDRREGGLCWNEMSVALNCRDSAVGNINLNRPKLICKQHLSFCLAFAGSCSRKVILVTRYPAESPEGAQPLNATWHTQWLAFRRPAPITFITRLPFSQLSAKEYWKSTVIYPVVASL